MEYKKIIKEYLDKINDEVFLRQVCIILRTYIHKKNTK